MADFKINGKDFTYPASANTETKKAVYVVSQQVRNIAASQDEKTGNLKLNGKDTGFAISTPLTIQNDISSAFADSATAGKIAEQQAEFRKQQASANFAIALTRGTYYIEDCLPSGIRGKVLSGWYLENETSDKEAQEVSRLITEYIKSIPDGSVISCRRGSVFPVDKLVGYMPELFGADNRQVAVGGMTLTIDGAQPCIFAQNKNYCFYDFYGAEFICQRLGLNVLELFGGTGNVINYIKISTRAHKKFGYVRGADKDKMLFPPIDGWTKEAPHIGTGFADKGTFECGFNTTTLPHDLARYRNNAAHVEHVRQPAGYNKEKVLELGRNQATERFKSAGGYWDTNNESAFPQDDGTTSKEWGLWRGGQRGSRGNGICIYNTHKTTILDFDIRGFDGSAIQAGLYARIDCQDVIAGDTTTATKEGLVAYDTLICGGYFTDCYTGGIGAVRVDGFIVIGLNCTGNKVGHPDWHLGHTRAGGSISIDPGYMLWTSRYMPMIGVRFIRNRMGIAARKVVDAHTGNDIQIIENTGIAGYYGISIVVDERYASIRGGNSECEPTSFIHQESNIIVERNNVLSGGFGIHLINGGFGVLTRQNTKSWHLRANVKVRDNIIHGSYAGLIYNYGHHGFDISGNSVTFDNSLIQTYGEAFGMHRINTINVENGGTGYSAQTRIQASSNHPQANGFVATPVIEGGVIKSIRVIDGGTCFYASDTVTVSAIDPTGAGKGAVLTPTFATTSNAYMIGAEARYGYAQMNFERNSARNSPLGNWVRMLVCGRLIGSSICNNTFDITTYKMGQNSSMPYTYNYARMHNPGTITQALAHSGDHLDCIHFNNKSFEYVIRAKDGTETYPNPPLVKELVFSKALIKETPAGAPAAAKLMTKTEVIELINANNAGQPSTPQPSTPQPPAANEGSSIIFNFALAEAGANEATDTTGKVRIASLINNDKLKNPPDWAGAVAVDGGKKVMKAISGAGTPGAGSRYLEITGLDVKSGSDTVIMVPFKITSGGNANGSPASFIFAMNDTTPVANWLLTATDGGFMAGAAAGYKIDGNIVGPATLSKVYEHDKWHIAVLTKDMAFNKIRVGTNHVLSTWRNVIIGQGFRIITGANKEGIDKLYNELKKEYGIV